MFKKRLLLSTVAILAILLSNFAFAASIVNGNFNTDLTGWDVLTNGGSVQWDAGSAMLSTGSGDAPYSSVLVQGDDGNFSFNNPLLLGPGDDFLKFDASFLSLGADAQETGAGLFADNLQLWLYDANNWGDVLLAEIDALTNATSFSISLASYIGHSVAFSFELNDENDGLDSKVALDNIRLEQRAVNAVPLPSTLLLVIIGWFGLVRNVVRADQKVQS